MNSYSDFLELFLTEEPIDHLTLETNKYERFSICVLFVLLLQGYVEIV